MRLSKAFRKWPDLDLWVSMDSRIRAEQITALFRNVAWAVTAAAAGAAGLAILLGRLGVSDPWTAGGWCLWIAMGAGLHLLLRRAWGGAKPPSDRGLWWPTAFTAICLMEGLGWGWAPIFLVRPGHFDSVLLVLAVTLSVAAGSISAFSAYLPAYAAFFLATTMPYTLGSLGASDRLERASGLLMLLYIVGIGGLGVVANRSFRELSRLRLRTVALAEALHEQKDVAERANLAKSRFLAAASHDLRQPVHALGLFVGALRNSKLPRETQRLVEQIEASTAAMDTLFSALLDISRLDAGVVEVRPQVFPLQPLLTRICREHASDADSKGILLICRPSQAYVRSDPVLVERILRNLISNAVRYTQKGGVLVGCRARLGAVRIEVWDTGPGIAPELHDQVFQEYFQLANPERDRAKGLGLGLAIVRRLSELLDCDLTLRSRPPFGSRFSIVLPTARASEAFAEQAGEAEGGELPRGRVLVVDDQRAIREAMAALLTGWGYQVATAGSGEEAMTAASREAPDLIISDYRLGGEETGVAVIERLRRRHGRAIPAMLITGDTAPDRLAEAQASGLVLLHKPVANSKLRAALKILTRVAEPQPDSSEDRRVEPVR